MLFEFYYSLYLYTWYILLNCCCFNMNLIIDQRNYFVVNTQSIMFWLIIKQLNDIESYRAFNVSGRCREIFLICVKQRKHWSSYVCIHTSLSLLWWTIHFQPVFDSFFFLDDTFEPHLLSEPKYDGRYVAFGKDIDKQFINIRWCSKCVDIIDILPRLAPMEL